MDREKVIKGLHCCSHTDGVNCIYCPYDNTDEDCTALMSMDVLELLKEQEAVEPAMDEDTPGHWIVLENCSNAGVYCSECHTKIFDHYPMKKKFSYFCPHCGTRMEGQAVKL